MNGAPALRIAVIDDGENKLCFDKATMSHEHHDHCETSNTSKKRDPIYFFSAIVVVIAYALSFIPGVHAWAYVGLFIHHIQQQMNMMWWGLILSIVGVGVLNRIPREMVMTYFGSKKGLLGLAKATLAGTVFDMCSHGILVLAMKIYERGASLGQTMAFLIASPWNSFSLSLLLYALIGGRLTFLFLILSMVVAIITGWIFDQLVDRGYLPENPHRNQLSPQLTEPMARWTWSLESFLILLKDGLRGAKPVLKWIFFGMILSAVVTMLVPQDIFANYFGNSFKGLLLTLLAATGIEVCSEGSVPLAADLVTIAHAPGNAFVFLMAGVATDLTEFMALRETTKSLKIAIFLPLLTIPQILIFGLLINWGYL